MVLLLVLGKTGTLRGKVNFELLGGDDLSPLSACSVPQRKTHFGWCNLKKMTSLLLTGTHDFEHRCTGMSGYAASCSQSSFQGPHPCSHLYPRQENVPWRYTSGTPWLPQLGKLKKCIQLCKCRDPELHIALFCSLILVYFHFIFICMPAQLQTSEEGYTLFLLP